MLWKDKPQASHYFLLIDTEANEYKIYIPVTVTYLYTHSASCHHRVMFQSEFYSWKGNEAFCDIEVSFLMLQEL